MLVAALFLIYVNYKGWTVISSNGANNGLYFFLYELVFLILVFVMIWQREKVFGEILSWSWSARDVENIYNFTEVCDGFNIIDLPCNTLYSRIPSDVGTIYISNLIFFAVFRFNILLRNLVKEISRLFEQDYEKDSNNNLKISQLLFDSWEFRVNNNVEYKSLRESSLRKIQAEIYE